MRPQRISWFRLGIPAALVCTGLVNFSWGKGISSSRLKELTVQAEYFEKNADWAKACETYEAILGLERSQKDIKDRYHHAFRRWNQVSRHRDLSYRKEVLSLGFRPAQELYRLMIDTLLDNALDKKKVDAARLFRKGLDELRAALADPHFRQAYLPSASDDEIRAFKDLLSKTWNGHPIGDRHQAVKQVREVALAAFELLQLDTTVVVLEFTCGACYAIDNYTTYLTPSELRALCESLRGEFVGVGLIVGMAGNKLVIADIVPASSAAEHMPGLRRGDRVLSIDKKLTANLPPEVAQELLSGPAGSMVELGIEGIGGIRHVVSLTRRPIMLPSVAYQPKNDTIGYLHISSFQENTLTELDSALDNLTKAGMKVLVLDLRGNSGGLFETAIDSAKRFLASGVIASTQNSDSKYNTIYQARNPNALTVPMVLLIDGNTASAAEVLAGALKDNNRARLIGLNTFGKGCTQTVVKLPPAPGGVPTGGLRITVTRFFSPAGQPYSGKGVSPHLRVDRLPLDAVDHQLDEAIIEAQRLEMAAKSQ